MSAPQRYLLLAGLLALLLLAPACSGQTDANQEQAERGEPRDRPAGGQGQEEADRAPGLLDAEGTDAGVGASVEVGEVSLRLFAIRSEDVIHFAPGPGEGVGERDSASGEFVAVDFVAQNDGESSVTVQPEAVLEDDSGATHGREEAVPVPNLGEGGMELAAGQKRASTLFFAVPNGITPERLGVRVSGEPARFDLLSDERDRVPPEDYLRVYHLYFAQRAYEEAYEMYDPDTTQDVTLGDWLSFYEPLWGSRYIGLDSLNRFSVSDDEASFEMDRTFYDSDGEPVADPVLNAPVLQELVRADGAWDLVMGEDLISDIAAEVPRFTPPSETEEPEDNEENPDETETTVPEATAPEGTVPESTVLETTASPAGDYGCADFSTQEEAQAYLTPGDPYVLDPDGNGLACDNLP